MANYLFEIVRIGNSVKVTAIDPQTSIEAVIVGSARMTQYSLQQAAARKLKRLIENKSTLKR